MTLTRKRADGFCHPVDPPNHTANNPTAPTEGEQEAARRKHEMLLALQLSETRAFLRIVMPPGTSTIALDDAADDAGFDTGILYDPHVLGELLECTFDHFKRFGQDRLGRRKAHLPKRIRPFDVPPEVVEAFIADRKRDRDRPAAQRRRTRKRAAKAAAKRAIEQEAGLDPRDRSLLSVLQSDEWISVRAAALRVRRHGAWRRPDAKLPDVSSIRRRIAEMMPELSGYIESRSDRDRRGWPMTMIRLRPSPEKRCVARPVA